MRRQALLVAGVAAATAVSALLAYRPVWRALSKMDPEIERIASGFFWSHTVPCLGVGLAFILLAVGLSGRRQLAAALLLAAAPLAVVAADLLLLARS